MLVNSKCIVFVMADVQFNLRIPEELKDKVKDAAKESGRSINAEAQYRLEQSFTRHISATEIVENIKDISGSLAAENFIAILKVAEDHENLNKRLLETNEKIISLLEKQKK